MLPQQRRNYFGLGTLRILRLRLRPDQPHIRSPREAAAPMSRLRQARLRRTPPGSAETDRVPVDCFNLFRSPFRRSSQWRPRTSAVRDGQSANTRGGRPPPPLPNRSCTSTDFGQPTASVTRWRVSVLPSTPLPVPGVGRARWLLELIRCRAGESADFEVEACDAEGRLALPSHLVYGPDAKEAG